MKKRGAGCTKGSDRTWRGRKDKVNKFAGDECACVCVLCNQAGYCVRFFKKLM